MSALHTSIRRFTVRSASVVLTAALAVGGLASLANAEPSPAPTEVAETPAPQSPEPSPSPEADPPAPAPQELPPDPAPSAPQPTSSATESPTTSATPAPTDASTEVPPATVHVIAYASAPQSLFLSTDDGARSPLTQQQWLDMGSPPVTVEQVRYLAAPGTSATIYRATPSGFNAVSPADWARAGSPTPQSAVLGYVKTPWSATVFATLSYAYDRSAPASTALALTPGQWSALSPEERASLRAVAHVPGSTYFTWEANPGARYVRTPDGVETYLTTAQWQAAGSPTTTQRPGGYVKSRWSDAVWLVDSLTQAKAGRSLSWDEFLRAGNPTPRVLAHVPGTTYYAWQTNPADGIAVLPDGIEHRLTLSEWQAAGAPQWTIRAGGYVKSPWSNAVWKVESLTQADAGHSLSWDEYVAAGQPAPLAQAHVPGTTYYAWESNTAEGYAVLPDGVQHRLTFGEWQAAGSPRWSVKPGGYVKSPWSNAVWKVESLTQSGAGHSLSWDEYVAAGKPTPWYPPHVPGTTYFAYETNRNEGYALLPDGVEHRLTFQEWQRAGAPGWSLRSGGYVKSAWSDSVWKVDSLVQGQAGWSLSRGQWEALGAPTPWVAPHVPGTTYFAWQSNTSQGYARLPDGVEHRLSFGEWQSAGSPSWSIRAGGFYRVPFSDAVWFFPVLGSTQGAAAMSHAWYVNSGSPTPQTVGNVPGGSYTQDWGTSEIHFSALGVEADVPYWGWAAAGYPQPRTTYLPLFVYGTLRPGESAWGRLAGVATSIGWNARVGGMSMYAHRSGAWPFMVPNGNGVTGDLIYIDPSRYASTIAATDAYEQYNPSRPASGQAYYRTVITTTGGQRAFAYVAGPAQAAAIRTSGRYIPSGDWKSR